MQKKKEQILAGCIYKYHFRLEKVILEVSLLAILTVVGLGLHNGFGVHKPDSFQDGPFWKESSEYLMEIRLVYDWISCWN